MITELTGGPTVWQGSTLPLTATQLNDLNTGNYYVTIATASNPNGEVRGQVELAILPATYGGGCPASKWYSVQPRL